MAEQSVFQLQIATPEQIAFSENVEYAVFTGVDGELGVLPHHAAILSELSIGSITITAGGKKKLFAVSGGFLEMRDNKATVVADTVESADCIDVMRAEKSKEEAQKLLETGNDYEKMSAELQIKKANNRIKVAAIKV